MECPYIVIESTPGVFYSVPATNLAFEERRRRNEIVDHKSNTKKEEVIHTDEDMIKVVTMCQTNDCQNQREMQVKEKGEPSHVKDKRKVFAKKEWKSLNIAEDKERKVLEDKIGFDNECQDHSAKAEAIILSRDSMRHIGDWFYPEGGWGWKVVMTSLILNVLSIGLIMSQGQVMVISINARVGNETNNMTTGI